MSSSGWSLAFPLVVVVFGLLGSAASGQGLLRLNYYAENCPRAEAIIKDQVDKLYQEHGNTAVSWIRNLFHDCMVEVTSLASMLHMNHNSISLLLKPIPSASIAEYVS